MQDHVIIYFNESKTLALKLQKALSWPAVKVTPKKYSFGEFTLEVNQEVKAKNAYIVTKATRETSKHLLEIFLVADILTKHGVKEIKLIAPYLPFSRQDRRINVNRSVASEVIATLLEKAGINEIITFDLHNERILDFYNLRVTHLSMLDAFVTHFKHLNLSDIAIVAPDYGRFRAANYVKERFPNASLIQISKERLPSGEVVVTDIAGDAQGRTAIIIEDIIDTGNTLISAIKKLYEQGVKKCYVAATHGIFSGDALTKLTALNVDGIVISNTVLTVKESAKLKIIDITPELVNGLKRAQT